MIDYIGKCVGTNSWACLDANSPSWLIQVHLFAAVCIVHAGGAIISI